MNRKAHPRPRTFVSLITFGLLVVACGSPAALGDTSAPTESAAPAEAPAAAPVELQAWVLGNSGDGIKNALPGFEAKYPNIKVNLQVFGWNDLQPKLQAALAASSGAPDVVEVFTDNVRTFYEAGAFLLLDTQIEPYKGDIATIGLLGTQSASGNIYGLSWSVSPSLLFYRADIFDKEGVDPTTLKTWDDLIAAGKKVTHDGQYMFLTASQSTQPQYFNYFTGMLSELGGSPFDQNDNITINEGGRALRVFQNMQAIRDAKISLDVDAWWTPAFEAALKGGDLASFASGVFHVGILKQTAPDAAGLWRVQLSPTFSDGQPTGIFTGSGRTLAIPAQSPNSEAAWKFIEYMMLTPEGIQATWEGGAILPSYTPAFGADYFNKPDPYYGGQPVGQVVMDGMTKLEGQDWYNGPIPSGVLANEVVGPQLQALMTGKTDAEGALYAMLQAMNSAMP